MPRQAGQKDRSPGVGLVELLRVEIRLGEAVHVTMVGQSPSVHAVAKNVVDMVGCRIHPIIGRAV